MHSLTFLFLGSQYNKHGFFNKMLYCLACSIWIRIHMIIFFALWQVDIQCKSLIYFLDLISLTLKKNQSSVKTNAHFPVLSALLNAGPVMAAEGFGGGTDVDWCSTFDEGCVHDVVWFRWLHKVK